MQDSQKLIKLLAGNEVRFVIIGGLAAVVHGSSVVTEDLDICVSFDRENVRRLLDALDKINPEHRLIGKKRALKEGVEEISSFKNIYLTTDLGFIDILSSVAGVGGFNDVADRSVELDLFGFKCRVLDIDAVIESKKTMGRPKDKETVVQLSAIREKQTR